MSRRLEGQKPFTHKKKQSHLHKYKTGLLLKAFNSISHAFSNVFKSSLMVHPSHSMVHKVCEDAEAGISVPETGLR